MQDEVVVSVVIPVRNGDQWLGEVIPAILDQELDVKFEILILDSGSTDRTRSILSNFPVRIVDVPAGSFNHGLTRNMGVREAKGKFIAFTVQDAKPVGRQWLAHLLEHLRDGNVAGVCGLQMVPHHPDKNPVEWFRPISEPTARMVNMPEPGMFDRLTPDQQLALCRWDDVNAMYRREVLESIPFRKTDFAEDALWARDALRSGHTLVFDPSAQVEHYHHEDPDYAFRRTFTVQYHFHKYFGILPVAETTGLRGFLSMARLLWREKGISFPKKWYWLKYNLRNRKASRRAINLLLRTLDEGGEDALDARHAEVCGVVPQALKTKH